MENDARDTKIAELGKRINWLEERLRLVEENENAGIKIRLSDDATLMDALRSIEARISLLESHRHQHVAETEITVRSDDDSVRDIFDGGNVSNRRNL